MPADAPLDLLPAETAEAPVARRDTPQQQPDRPAEIPAVVPAEGAAAAPPPVHPLGNVCTAAARTDWRSLPVRHRRPGDVDG